MEDKERERERHTHRGDGEGKMRTKKWFLKKILKTPKDWESDREEIYRLKNV